jgi:hypothetical protein
MSDKRDYSAPAPASRSRVSTLSDRSELEARTPPKGKRPAPGWTIAAWVAAAAAAAGVGTWASWHEERPVRRHGTEARLIVVKAAQRADALRRAQVWLPPEVPVEQADFSQPPAGKGAFRTDEVVTCRFQAHYSEGMSPKFRCVLPTGETIKVKYGRANTETVSEVAGTRLLSALGFGADRMYVVARVRCQGCPRWPYARLRWMDELMAPLHTAVDFDWAVIERLFPAPALETRDTVGWSFQELPAIDPTAGGASRAQVDALRLMAAFLANWDTKSSNQRLVCLPGDPRDTPDAPCRRPFLLMQDVGASFGPWSMDPDGWAAHPLWADPTHCRLNMRSLPFQGATFGDVEVTEGGRQMAARLLRSLSEAQVAGLFTAARADRYPSYASPQGRDVGHWVRVFEDRVRQLSDHPACALD